MDEVGAALVAIALVLCAVFVPSAFITGISGQFYRQFALTIAGATVISLIVSLTLSPALCALLLKPHHERGKARLVVSGRCSGFFGWFNLGLRQACRGLWLARRPRGPRYAVIMLVVYAGIIAVRPQRIPQDADRLHSALDRGYLIVVAQLPPGSSLARTDEVQRRIVDTGAEGAGRASAR